MKNLAFKLVMATLILAACVTINVYFPVAAAEKAADQIIGDVIGKSGAAPQAPRTTPIGRSQPAESSPGSAALEQMVLIAVERTLNAVTSSAIAATPDLDVSTPTIRQITDAMKARHGQLSSYYDAGAIGYTADGRVDIRDANSISLSERNVVRTLLADENKDRAALYAEIARANGHPEWSTDIRATFAKRWIANAKAGWYYNDGSGWKQK